MHSWEPTECLGIQILTIKLLLVISIVFGFFWDTLYSYFFMLIFILHKREGVLQFPPPVFSIPRGIYMLCFHVDVDFIVEIWLYNERILFD